MQLAMTLWHFKSIFPAEYKHIEYKKPDKIWQCQR